MQINILARGFEMTEGLRVHAERRLGFAIGWARPHVRKVTVRLGDLNGPRGGEDKRCLIQIGLLAGGELVVEDIDPDLYVAIDRAAGRADRTVARRLKRQRDQDAARPDRCVGVKTTRASTAYEFLVPGELHAMPGL